MGRNISAADLLAGKPIKALAEESRTWRGLSCASLAERYALHRSLSANETATAAVTADAGDQPHFAARTKPEG